MAHTWFVPVETRALSTRLFHPSELDTDDTHPRVTEKRAPPHKRSAVSLPCIVRSTHTAMKSPTEEAQNVHAHSARATRERVRRLRARLRKIHRRTSTAGKLERDK